MKNKTGPRRESFVKIALMCGVASSLVYTAMNILVPLMIPDYDWRSQTVSELSAVGAPYRMLWVWLGVFYTMLVIIFGWGVLQIGRSRGAIRVTGSAMLIYAVASLVWPFAPMHSRDVLAQGGGTISDTLHLILAAVTVLMMVIIITSGAIALDKRFRIYSALTIALLLFFGYLTAGETDKIAANLSTPWAGVWERVNIGVYMIWIAMLAVKLQRWPD